MRFSAATELADQITSITGWTNAADAELRITVDHARGRLVATARNGDRYAVKFLDATHPLKHDAIAAEIARWLDGHQLTKETTP